MNFSSSVRGNNNTGSQWVSEYISQWQFNITIFFLIVEGHRRSVYHNYWWSMAFFIIDIDRPWKVTRNISDIRSLSVTLIYFFSFFCYIYPMIFNIKCIILWSRSVFYTYISMYICANNFIFINSHSIIQNIH